MKTVYINNKYISLTEIQKCIEAFENISEPEKIITIEAKQKIEGVDPLLIAYFMLFKNQNKNIQINLKLPHNPIDASDNKLEYQLKQFGTYAYLMTGLDVFNIIFGKKNNIITSFNLEKSDNFPKGWYTFSESYFPIIFITDDNKNLDFIFKTSLNKLLTKHKLPDINKLENDIKWEKNSENLRNKYHETIREISSPKEKEISIINLARMYFINALNEAKIAHLFFENEYNKNDFIKTDKDDKSEDKEKIQAGNLANENALGYYKNIKPIFEELANNSLFHQFLFSTILTTEILVDKESGKDILTQTTKDSFTNKIKNLWGFTKDLVAGIKELAKNIPEHSEPGFGAISLRLFEITKWINTKTSECGNNDNIYVKYKNCLDKEHFSSKTSIIDINIIDIGKNGVIPTLIKHTEELLSKLEGKNSAIKKLISDDLEDLTNNNIGFKNLLDSKTQQLNQQSKRAIAHFGLLTFSKLVSQVEGLLIASSKNIENNRESVAPSEFDINYAHPIETGTNYNVILPIQASETYSTHLPDRIKFPYEISAKEIKGIEKLFDYELINSEELKNMEDSANPVNYLVEIDFDSTRVDNRDDEFNIWNCIFQKVNSRPIFLDKKIIFCLNLKNVTLNESQLFRLLGEWELHYPSIPLIVFNINNELYQQLIKINGAFNSINENLPYWNEDISILVYSYIEVRGNRFYFSDVLWGKNIEDFININWLVNLSSFNSTSMLHSKKGLLSNSIAGYTGELNPNTELFFSNKNSLLPFDLVLKHSDADTLFEQNALVLLKNELK